MSLPAVQVSCRDGWVERRGWHRQTIQLTFVPELLVRFVNVYSTL